MNEEKEPLWKKAWRPLAAYVYLSICAFDFVVMPMTYSSRHSPEKVVELALKFDNPTAQVSALSAMQKNQEWKPLTTQGNGIFHLAFGALLTGAAIGRSQEKKAKIEKAPL